MLDQLLLLNFELAGLRQAYDGDLQEALVELETLSKAASEEEVPEPDADAVENARILLPKLFALLPVRYRVSPTERRGVAIDAPMRWGGLRRRGMCSGRYGVLLRNDRRKQPPSEVLPNGRVTGCVHRKSSARPRGRLSTVEAIQQSEGLWRDVYRPKEKKALDRPVQERRYNSITRGVFSSTQGPDAKVSTNLYDRVSREYATSQGDLRSGANPRIERGPGLARDPGKRCRRRTSPNSAFTPRRQPVPRRNPTAGRTHKELGRC